MKTMNLVVVCLWSLTYVIIADCQDPCSDGLHDVIDDQWRSTSFITSTTRCDDNLKENWYRVQNNGTDADMPTSCHEKGCGAKFPVWMNETIPTSSEGIVNRTVCLHNSFFLGCCYHRWEIMVKNCGLFRVYHLIPTVGCNIAYCFDPSSYIDTTENTTTTCKPTETTTANLPTTHDHVTETEEMTTIPPTKTTAQSVFKSTNHGLDSTSDEMSPAGVTTSTSLKQESTSHVTGYAAVRPGNDEKNIIWMIVGFAGICFSFIGIIIAVGICLKRRTQNQSDDTQSTADLTSPNTNHDNVPPEQSQVINTDRTDSDSPNLKENEYAEINEDNEELLPGTTIHPSLENNTQFVVSNSVKTVVSTNQQLSTGEYSPYEIGPQNSQAPENNENLQPEQHVPSSKNGYHHKPQNNSHYDPNEAENIILTSVVNTDQKPKEDHKNTYKKRSQISESQVYYSVPHPPQSIPTKEQSQVYYSVPHPPQSIPTKEQSHDYYSCSQPKQYK